MKSFVINLDELHCAIHFLMITSKTHKMQVRKAISDLKKQKYPVSKEDEKLIDEVFSDCVNNPGFTFELCDTNMAIGIRTEFLDDLSYAFGIYVHEAVHAMHAITRNLGLSMDDDELRAIYMQNLTEKIARKLLKNKV